MIKVYIKTAWRSIIKNRLFSLINVLGLSIGLAASLLILEYVSFELSYDRFNENAANIYRIYNDRYQHGKLIQHGIVTYSAVSKAMKAEFPEIVDYTRVEPGGETVVFYNGQKLGGQREFAVENSFLKMFSYKLLVGNPATALSEPRCIVITQSLAKKLFHVTDNNLYSTLGKTVAIVTPSYLFKITGICEDVPANSHLQFDCLISYITLYSGKSAWTDADYNFTTSQFWHYIMLKPGSDYKNLQEKLADFSVHHFRGSAVTGSVEKFYLQPLLNAHLHSDFEYEIGNTANGTVVWGVFIIAVLIIIIAWVNYVNLTAAKSMERATEVGVRKIVGATRGQLLSQFMTESLMTNLFSLTIAVIIIVFIQGPFNTLINHSFSLNTLLEKSFGGYNFPVFIIVFILTGIFISGFYPSLILSSFKPISVLKGKFVARVGGITLRKALVIGQFAVTIALIISSIVVLEQLRFVNKQNLGFNISQMLIVKGPELTKWDTTLKQKQDAFINEIKGIPGVSGAAFSSNVPGDELGRSSTIGRSDRPSIGKFTIRINWISPGFINVYQMNMLAGRPLSSTDYQPNGLIGLHNVVLSLTAIKMLGFNSPEDAIGRQISWEKGDYSIVGVVADFHQRSLHYPIEPTMFMSGTSPIMPFSIRVSPRNINATVHAIQHRYDTILPGNIFNYYFLDDKFNEQYNSDLLFGRLFFIFSGIAIFIACLGLLGLSLFATMQRTKEIGVRKVLGASVSSIVLMLSRDFILLILLATLIASPVAWYIMRNWLQGFATHITMSWWIFIASALLATTIAAVTISFQTIKAAIANPARSLRSE